MAAETVIDMDVRLEAGREYLAALRKLGFRPDALLWAGVGESSRESRMELLIITSWADHIGPKAVYDLLFEAYDASATPKEVDPFSVTLLSPHTTVANDFYNAVNTLRLRSDRDEIRPIIVLGMADYFTTPDWVILAGRSKSTQFDDARRFIAFQNKVAQLAA